MTTEGETRLLERPFLVLATQNPIEHEGTYPLPEAQLDRFLLRISVGYPSREDEIGILEQRRDRAHRRRRAASRSSTRETLRGMQRALEDVYVAESVGDYIVDVVRATREAASVQVGASPRGTLAILKLARARAALDGRDFVVPDDVKAVAGPALAHRLSLRPELWVQQVRAEDVVAERLATVPTPPAEESDPRRLSRRSAAYAALGGLALLAALVAAAARARRARARRSCSCSRPASSPPATPTCALGTGRPEPGARGRRRSSSRSSWRPSGRSRGPRCCSSCRPAWSRTAPTRPRSG